MRFCAVALAVVMLALVMSRRWDVVDVGDLIVDQRNGLFEKEQQHDMAKCPNCEKCITDLRADNAAIRAQNAALISAAQKQDQREHELMMERRELARHAANSWTRRCPGCGLSKTETRVAGHLPCCPVALAERILAEPTATAGATGSGDCHNGQTNPRAISGDNAPYLAQGVES